MQITKNKDGSTTRRDDCPIHAEPLPVQPESDGLVELLQELMDASAPYLQRKKITPRHECGELNRVWAKCDAKLKPNVTGELEKTSK